MTIERSDLLVLADALTEKRGECGPCLVYVIEHERLGLTKVGIAAWNSSRLGRWSRRGWRLVSLDVVPDRAAALGEEAVRLNRLRRNGRHVRPQDMPDGDADGHTETFWTTGAAPVVDDEAELRHWFGEVDRWDQAAARAELESARIFAEGRARNARHKINALQPNHTTKTTP